MAKRKYQYKDIVIKDRISIVDEEKKRYLLYIPLENEIQRKVMVIMKNPSQANKTQSDYTVNKVISWCSQYYKEIFIANLFPLYGTDPVSLKKYTKEKKFDKDIEKNLEQIEKVLNDNNIEEVFIAWGTDGKLGYKKAYDTVIDKMMNILKKNGKRIFAIKNQNSQTFNKIYPLHPRAWQTIKGVEKIKWE